MLYHALAGSDAIVCESTARFNCIIAPVLLPTCPKLASHVPNFTASARRVRTLAMTHAVI